MRNSTIRNPLAKHPVKFVLFLFVSLLLTHKSLAVQTVEKVELERYMGRWFEIASIPVFFQRNCARNVTAEYELLDNGKVKVVNSCEKENGEYEVANGVARVRNKSTNAELGVCFAPFCSQLSFLEGQYKILALDQDYQYALVGEDKTKYGWILARTPFLSLDVLSNLEREIRRQGYDSCEFLVTLQDGGAFEQREPLCEVIKK